MDVIDDSHFMGFEFKMTFAGIYFIAIASRSILNFDGLVQERRNSSALAMELRLSCTNLSIYTPTKTRWWLRIVAVCLDIVGCEVVCDDD